MPMFFQDALGDEAVTQRVVITLGVVVTVAQMAAADKHGVRLLGKGAQDELQIDPARAHQADHAQIRRILETRDARQIGAAIAAPVAQKADDDGFEFSGGGHSRYLGLALSNFRKRGVNLDEHLVVREV